MPPYNKALDWMQFSYTGDWTGDYILTASKGLINYFLAGGEPLFVPALQWKTIPCDRDEEYPGGIP